MQQLVNARAAQAASAQKQTSAAIPEFLDVYPGNIRKDDVLDARTETIIGCYADRLIASGAFREYERDDIRQDMRLLLFRKMASFNPAKGDRYSYASIVIANGYKNMLKIRDRELKRRGGFLSLQDIPEGSDEPLENAVSSDDYEMTIGGKMLPAARRQDYADAKAAFFASLSERDRKICEAFMQYGSAEKAAPHIGIPARTILWRLQNPIRELAVANGLNEFFGGAAR